MSEVTRHSSGVRALLLIFISGLVAHCIPFLFPPPSIAASSPLGVLSHWKSINTTRSAKQNAWYACVCVCVLKQHAATHFSALAPPRLLLHRGFIIHSAGLIGSSSY